VVVLCRHIDSAGGDLSVAIPSFAKARQPDGEAIARLSMLNYREMRDHTASLAFRLQKKVCKSDHF